MRFTSLLLAVRRPKVPSWKRVNQHYRYTQDPPESIEAQVENLPGYQRPKVKVEPVKNWKFMKGDVVQVLKGKDKGKTGTIVDIVRERNWVIVEGLNFKYEYVGQMEGYEGTMVGREQPYLHREVQLVDPSDSQPCEVDFRYTEAGDRVRVSRRTGRIIPIPQKTLDETDFSTYIDQPKDTKTDDVCLRTFTPVLKSVEDNLIDRYNIRDPRPHPKTYWY